MEDNIWGKARSQLLGASEELRKKDDDLGKPVKAHVSRPQAWTPVRTPPRRSLKRLGLLCLVAVLIYIFIHNLPTDVGIRDRRRPVYLHPGDTADLVKPLRTPPQRPKPATKPTRNPDTSQDDREPDGAPESSDTPAAPAGAFNGVIKFYDLALSLRSIHSTRGGSAVNKNILFAASSLKSAASLLPIACEMGVELRSYVHFALMSRSVIAIDELMEVNGIDERCEIIFHDARPDFSEISTEARQELAAARAFYHIHAYMHPQAVIIDDSDVEEPSFLRGLREQAKVSSTPIIGVPQDGAQNLMWISKLDSAALASWHKVSVDILVQASSGSSGSLIRLLKSLRAADFTASAVPHLTIEIPHDIDAATMQYLEGFDWPPLAAPNPSNVRQLSIRHRIFTRSVNEEDASIKFLESFWPTRAAHSHVLVLSPRVELSSSFFHYMKYTMLEYVYSKTAQGQGWNERLFGLSLELPSVNLGAKPFEPPNSGQKPSPFLWEAPNSNAILILGERWIELHSFVTKGLSKLRASAETPSMMAEKLVSKKSPSWLEHALRLVRARGYLTTYPSALTARSLATVHNELYTPPEEYPADMSRESIAKQQHQHEDKLEEGSAIKTLPDEQRLPSFGKMPMLRWDGEVTELQSLNIAAEEYADEFRRTVGGCTSSNKDIPPDKSARDLFCVTDGDPAQKAAE